MNLNGKLRKKLRGPSKNLGGHGPPRPPLRIATGETNWLDKSDITIFVKFTRKLKEGLQ